MLLQFSVSNYRCLRELQTLNFAASPQDKSLPENCIPVELPGVAGKRWLKGVALYGANASGKTTILEALAALNSLVENSAKATDPSDPLTQIEPFALCPADRQKPTAFAVSLVAENIRYEYRVAATTARIWHESLRAFPKKVEQLWFCRDWDAAANRYAWTPERPSGFERDRQLEGYTLSNVLFLSKAVANNRADLAPVFRWFKDRLSFVDLSVQGKLGPGFTLGLMEKDSALQAKIVALLRHADLGVTDARIIDDRPSGADLAKMVKELPMELQNQFLKRRWTKPALTHHTTTADSVPLPWGSESAGTQRLFSVAGPWFDILEKGRIICVDELESSMHPLMVRELLRVFFNPSENPHGAQILFTTHNPLLLDETLLRRDQVWFTEKDAAGATHLYPLSDFSPRRGESLVRGYLSGRYGGVPFLPNGLLGATSNPETAVDGEKQNGKP